MQKTVFTSALGPEIGATCATQNHRLDVQGLRAIAVLLVVAFHSGLPAPGGYVGVDVFFVISGFVITAMLQREWSTTGRIRFARFYIRRFKRLSPALAVVSCVTVIVSALVLSPFGTQQNAAKTAIGGMLFVANAVIAKTTGGYFDPPAGTNPLLNIWSLSVEEQFYLVFPSVIALGWLLAKRNHFPKLAAPLFIGGIAAISFALAIVGSTRFGTALSIAPLIGFYSPVVRSWEFAVGALIALTLSADLVIPRSLTTTAGVVGVTLLVVSVCFITRFTPFPGLWTLLPVTGSALLIVAGYDGANPVSRALARTPLVKIGDWSYSIYLWHWPMIAFAGLVWPSSNWAMFIAATLSFLPAIASYHWVEQPIRNYRDFSRSQFARLATTTLMVPILLSVGLWQAARTLFWHEPAVAMETRMTMPTGWKSPLCISKVPVSNRDVKQCRWQNDAPGTPIYLIGDSDAMQFSEALRNVGQALHRPVTALASDGCPLIDVFLQLKTDPQFMMRCREDYTAMMNWLTKSPPGLVIIGSVDRYWRDSNYRIRDTGSKDLVNLDLKSNAEKLDRGLTRTVEQLEKAGHSVLLLQTIPPYVVAPYTSLEIKCTGWRALDGRCPLIDEMPLKFANELQKDSRNGIENVAVKTGASIFDFRRYFCSNGTCSTRINGIDMYMPDGYHLNKTGSEAVTDILIDAIKSATDSKSE